MGVLSSILSKFGYAKRSGTANPSQWLIDWVGGGETASGVRVNEQSALRHTPFWSAVRVISSTLAALPFLVYHRLDGGGKERVTEHRVYRLLHDRPNDYIDSLTLMETLQGHVLTYGNGYAEIQRDGAARPVALWPLLPNRTARKITKDGVPYYEVRLPAGGEVQLPDYNVLHIKGLGFDGYTGYNVVQYHKEAIAYGVAVKEYGARFFGNDASPGGVLEHPQQLGDKAFKHLVDEWERGHRGMSDKHRVAILEEGMKFNKTSVDPEQAQALDVQKFTVDDCARIFNIPPHKIGSMEFSKYNNVEHLQIDFVTQTMYYWFRKWEAECNYKLFMPSEHGRLFCELLVDGLLRGDIKSRYEAYNIGRTAGFLCVDDIREKENLNPLPDGKGQIFLEPLNMKAAGSPDPGKAARAADADDDTDRAHRDLIACAVDRIMTKQSKTGYRIDSLRWAIEVLTAPARAYASIRGVYAADADVILDRVLSEYIKPAAVFDAAAGEHVTQQIIKQLGGTNDAS